MQALGGVSFTARDGQITALLGPNGAGKTTLLRTLVGMLKRDHGTIAIDGVDPERDPLAVRANIGFLTDQFGLYERLTTREYLTYFGELNGMAGAACASASTKCRRCSRWTTSWSAAARAFRRASASRWRWRARCCTARATCCWTNRRAAST